MEIQKLHSKVQSGEGSKARLQQEAAPLSSYFVIFTNEDTVCFTVTTT